MIALIVAQKKGTITEQKLHELLVEMENIPARVEEALKLNDQIDVASEARKNSSFPTPMTRGLPFLAATSTSGSSADMITMAYAPTTFVSASLTASSREQPSSFLISSMK